MLRALLKAGGDPGVSFTSRLAALSASAFIVKAKVLQEATMRSERNPERAAPSAYASGQGPGGRPVRRPEPASAADVVLSSSTAAARRCAGPDGRRCG